MTVPAGTEDGEGPVNIVAVYRKLVGRGVAPTRAPMRASLAAVAVVFVAWGGLAAPVAAGAAAGHEVPLNGSWESVEVGTLSFPSLSVALEGTGNATHLGQFTE